MDAKELRGESALAERSSDGGAKFALTAPALQYDRSKPCQELGSNSFKVDGQSARPCAVIGPDRVAPSARDAFPKKANVEPWLSPDSLYRRPPDYPHKMSEYQDPTRNISPRQTFQENMQRISMPPGYNTLKVNEDPAYASKNIKLNVPMEAKYCDVPYNVNPMSSDQKNLRNSDHSVSNVNPLLVRSIPHGWPAGSVGVRPLRPYGAPDVYQYPDYSSCTGPRLPLSRPHASSHDEATPMYPEPFYHEGNIRYKPYPNIKERYPQTRYEYVGNYSNPYHSPHPFATHKYELPKTMPNHPYPSYPQAPLKYTDRVPEPVMDGYQRSFNQQSNYGVPFRNPVIHPPYRSMPGNPLQNKLHPYPSDGPNRQTVSNKQPYDPNNKMYVDYEISRPKAYPMNDNFYVSEMSRSYHTKNPIILPNYPPANLHGMNSHPYIQLKNYEYARLKGLDPSIMNNPLTKLPMQFSPSTLAISPADSNASNDTVQTHGTSQEDCGYVSQSSITSGRSIDNRLPMDIYGRHDYRFSPIVRGSSLARPDSNCNQMSTSKKDIRQFISSWNEGDDENVENNSKRDVAKTISTETHNFHKQIEHSDNQEQLYVLGLVNVPSEELGKYEHIQKVSKLPENIKGYNSLELLNQFEEAIESSNINNINPPTQREIQIPYKNVTHRQDTLPRAVSPLDVEAKISQSVIHKDVGCNFEIKPCSPKMLNVQVAAPVQNILNERVIEKVANPQSRKSPIILQHANENMDSVLNNKSIKYPLINTASSCKMINNQLLSEASAVDHLKGNYSLQDLESNLGVCLASLPRLDNDIELNFPEVNQQFINANKTESVITKSLSKDLPALDIERPEITSLKTNAGSEYDLSYPFSPKSKIDTDKEFPRLSKYRKLKKNITDDSDITQAKAQATRVDSVIIKNPDNTRIYEDNTDTFRSGGYLRKDSQEYAINLATQAKNCQAQSELDKKYIISSRENTENQSPSNFMTHPITENVFSKDCNVVEASNDNEVDMQTEDLSMTYKDVSKRYLDKAVLDMPMNLSPQTKCSVGVDEEIKNSKNSDKIKRNKDTIVIAKNYQLNAISTPGDKIALEELHEPYEDKIPENLNNSPHANTQVSPKIEEHTTSSLNPNAPILPKASVASLESDTQVLPKPEQHIVSSLNSDSPVLTKTEEYTVSTLNSDTPVLSEAEAHIVSSLNSDITVLSKAEHTVSSLYPETPVLPNAENRTVPTLDSGTSVLSNAEDHTASSLNPDAPILAKAEHTVSSLKSDTQVSPKSEEHIVSSLNSDTPVLSKSEEYAVSSLYSDTLVFSKVEEHIVSSLNSDTPVLSKATAYNLNSDTEILSKVAEHTVSISNLREGCHYAESNILHHPEKNELNLSSMDGTEETTIEQILPPQSSTLLTTDKGKIDKTVFEKYTCSRSAISKSADDDNTELLKHISTDEPCKEKSFCQNPESSHEETNELSQSDITRSKCIKGVDNIYKPKLRRNKIRDDISRRKISTESTSTIDTTVLKDNIRLNNKKHKFTVHNENENSIEKPTFDTRHVISDMKIANDSFEQEKIDIGAKDVNEINLTKTPVVGEVTTTFENDMRFSDESQYQHISDSSAYNNITETTTSELSENIEKIPEFNTNINFNLHGPSTSNIDVTHESSKRVTLINEMKMNGYGTIDKPLKKRESSVSLDKNEQLNNKTNNDYDDPKQTSLKIREKFQATELSSNENISHMCFESCKEMDDSNKEITNTKNNLTIPRCVRKELFSSRFQNLLICNEGVSIFNKIVVSKTFQVQPTLQKLDYNSSVKLKQGNVQDTDLVLKKYEKHRTNPNENIQHLNQKVDGTEINQEVDDTELNQEVDDISLMNSTDESFKRLNTCISLQNTVGHVKEEKLVEKDVDQLEEKQHRNKIITLNIEAKINNSEHLRNLREKSTKETYHENLTLNCRALSTEEKIDDLDGEVRGTRFDQEINLELSNINVQTNISETTHEHDEIINEVQKFDQKEIRSRNQDDSHKHSLSRTLSDKPRFFLKRSLSDSALDIYDGDADESPERKRFLLPKRRKKCFNFDSNNIEESHFLNIIQNSRRNSISTLCNENNNISFCILIDDNCIIAEENYDQEDGNLGHAEGSCLNDVQEENCNEMTANLNGEDANLAESEEEKLWVENVGYEEIIETEDIAENIVIGEPTSPKDTDSSDYESDDGDMGILSSAEIDHTNKVKHIYGDNMCTNDALLVDALYRTPQMDVNKKLMDRESQIAEKTKYYDSDSLEMLLAEPINNYQYVTTESKPQFNICPSLKIPRESTPDYVVNDKRCKEDSTLLLTNENLPDAENTECNKSSTCPNINEKPNDNTAHSCESSLDKVFSYEHNEDGSYTSSSPEVSSTTSEEKNSSILLKISNYKGSRISEVNSLSNMHIANQKENSCKFTEKEYLNPNYSNNSHRPLITKAAQKYIPPLKETIPDLKVKLTLPQQSLLKLKENKVSKEEPKLSSRNVCCNNNNIHLRKEIPKKIKPKFEDVLKNIDEIQFQKHKNKNKKSRQTIPKVVIKKTGNGSHYASSSAKTSFNPDLTGRKWQPWVFIEKNRFVDKMALKNKKKAVFSHRKKTFVLDEKFCKYKSISSAKFIISQPKLNEFSTGNLKYTIKLKHSY